MTSQLDKLRESRKSPVILKLQLISIRGKRPDSLVFVFEGIEDVPVYEEWISRTRARPKYEALAGNGKEQLLALRQMLDGDDLLRRTYFFVDSDHDEDGDADAHVYVLDAYSIENLLCNADALDSLLVDEFRCAGMPDVRAAIVEGFEKILRDFESCTLALHEGLFIARRERSRVSSKPDHAKDVLEIRIDSVCAKFTDVSEIFSAPLVTGGERLASLREEFASLPPHRSQRGKYVMQVFRGWVKAIADDRRALRPTMFPAGMPPLTGMPETFPLRRLASRTAVPAGLDEFVERAAAA